MLALQHTLTKEWHTLFPISYAGVGLFVDIHSYCHYYCAKPGYDPILSMGSSQITENELEIVDNLKANFPHATNIQTHLSVFCLQSG